MRKSVLLLLIILLTGGEVFSFATRVYDEYGNRVGTYRRVGDKYEFYDFYDRKVEKVDDIIQNAPKLETSSDNRKLRVYNTDMLPLDAYSYQGLYDTGFNIWYRNYPRRYARPYFIHTPKQPYIVRPRANGIKF